MIVCDELAFYLTAGDRKARTAFAELLRDPVARGRAGGIIIVAATQKPSADVVPTGLRDLFGFRWALRCSTAQASDTILGSDWSGQGFSAASIDPAQRGVGYLLHEGGLPVRCRAYHADDELLASVSGAASGRRLRQQSQEVGAAAARRPRP